MSDNDVPIEKVADFGRAPDDDRHPDRLLAPAQTCDRDGVTAMNTILRRKKSTESA
jgi:hypothetical protein